MEIRNRSEIRMLDKSTKEMLKMYNKHWYANDFGCLLYKQNDFGPGGAGILPYASGERHRIYTGTINNGIYNHHAQIAVFKDKYYYGWSNGPVNENDIGQRILIASSEDAVKWSESVCVSDYFGKGDSVNNCVGLLESRGRLYLINRSEQMEAYATDDGVTWTMAFAFEEKISWIMEAPRLTAEGRLLCICTTGENQPAILLWPGDNLCENPEIIPVKAPEGTSFLYGEGSWYQTGDGRIIAFWRDEELSCRLYVNYSDDGGKTFTELTISDIPNSISRIYAGKLPDGRYYLCGNAVNTYSDRRHLMLLLSDEGLVFNKVYVLLNDPTFQRLKGLYKVDGYQYPCCAVDGSKLLVAYSVNKEDMEYLILDLSRI